MANFVFLQACLHERERVQWAYWKTSNILIILPKNMSEKEFNPASPEYKKVEDLPKEHQGDFVNVPEGGFVRKSAVTISESLANGKYESETASMKEALMKDAVNQENRLRQLAEKEDFIFENIKKLNDLKVEIKLCDFYPKIKLIENKLWDIDDKFYNNPKKMGQTNEYEKIRYETLDLIYEKELDLCSTKEDFIDYSKDVRLGYTAAALEKWYSLCENENDVETMLNELSLRMNDELRMNDKNDKTIKDFLSEKKLSL